MAEGRTRRLAAIMFADMVGYTALMQEDEGGARVQRDRHREIFSSAVERHRGEELTRPYLRGLNTYWQAAILAHLDRKAEATRLRRQAFEEGQSVFTSLADLNFLPLWGYEPYEQLIAPKG